MHIRMNFITSVLSFGEFLQLTDQLFLFADLQF